MNLSAQIARHLREVYFGGNWTSVNFRDTLADLTWQQATRSIGPLNTIATLVFHTHYYVAAVCRVLTGGALDAKDEYSFNHPPIHDNEAWQALLNITWEDAERFAHLVGNLSDDKLGETFIEEKYGTYYRNLQGIIEHLHYHLGQIVILKKLIQQAD
jgi:hypothetical protein